MREESGIAAGLSGLPDGGGVGPLGDRFQPDLVRGTGGYSVSFNCPKGPNEIQPLLTLSYSTGSGNGPFGLGWRLSLLRIERRSDRGVPAYTDDDTFVIGDAEVLVNVGGGRFRPKSDTNSWMIERVGDLWRIRTGEGKTLLFGQTADSREADGLKVFAWHLDEERDAAGNSISYHYRRDQNRLYPDEVGYGIFRVKFLYEPRADAIRSGRSGFVRVTALRANAVELHCDRLAPTLIRSYALEYEPAQNGASLLTKFGLSATDGAQTSKAAELTFRYTASNFNDWNVHDVRSLIAPPGLDDRTAQLVDMTGDGLPDILQSFGSRMLLWRNPGDGSLEGPTVLEGVPSTVSLSSGNVALADLNGDGRVDLFVADQPLQLAFVANGKGGFEPDPVVFRSRPNLGLTATDTRLMDVDGDGVTDLIGAKRNYFLLFRHRVGEGWQEPQAVARVADLDRFPDVAFEDRGVRLADMTGDGLQDIVVLHSGDVGYWPYLGNGVWGDRVPMQNSPQFPVGYRDERVLAIDLDGDGCSDIIYFDSDRTRIWLNQSGTRFADPIEIPVAPLAGNARIVPADFFGDGRPGFLWTSTATGQYSSGYRFLRIDRGRMPDLLTVIDNGLGRRTTIEYANTTVMRFEDEQRGRDWLGQLPFVVPVVKTIVDRDTVGATQSTLSIHYHDGVYDGPQREFRGFRQVTVDMDGDDTMPASRQEYGFLQGDPDEPDLAARERQRAIAGSLESLRTYEQTSLGYELRHESLQTWDARVEFDDGAQRVFFPHLLQTESRELSPGAAPARVERTRLVDYDAHGNAGERIREYFADGNPASLIRTEERFVYTANEADWLVKLPVRTELRDAAGVPFAVKIHYYDGQPFVGLPEGQVSSGLATRTQELVLVESRLPADFIGGRDLTTLGYERKGGGDTAGFYATTAACRRDGRGNMVEKRDALGAVSTITYDADGVFPIEKSDPRGRVTRITFDPKSGEPARIELPDGRVVRNQTDALGRVIARFELDDAGAEQLTKCWAIDLASIPARVTSFTPENGGRLPSEFFGAADLGALRGVSIARVYLDGFGTQTVRIATAQDAPDASLRLVAAGRSRVNSRKKVAFEFPPLFVAGFDFPALPGDDTARLRYRYDGQGNLIETGGPGPAHFRTRRDTFTLEHFEGPSAGDFGSESPPGPVTRIERFDACNRAIRIEEAKGDGTSIATAYDLSVDGRIEVIRDDAGAEVARYFFAGPGDPVRITHRDAGTRTYYRDANGRVSELVRSDGSRLVYKYDVAGRLLRIEHAEPGSAVTSIVREIFFDADPGAPSAGRFLDERTALVREGGNETRFSYNRSGSTVRHEVTSSGIALGTAWEYNQRQDVTAITYPDGHRIAYVLDASGSLQQIPGVVSRVSYAPEGSIDGYTLANGVEVAIPVEAGSRRLSRVSASRAGVTLRSISYTYDQVGNIIGLHDEMPGATEHQTFGYDGLYRLTGFQAHADAAAGPLLRSENYQYDPQGNLLQIADQTLTYSDAVHSGRVTGVTSGGVRKDVVYDDRAAIRAWGTLTSLQFDPFDRLLQVTRADGTQSQFAYDAQNRRILKQVTTAAGTSSVRYAGNWFEKRDVSRVRHVYLGNRLVASDTTNAAGNQTVFFLYDHHGTLLLATDAGGGILQNQRYSPFGLAQVAGTVLDRYLGLETDGELGLVQLGERYYAPAIGRFISPDWYVLENPTRPMRMPQGFNVYSYALNNPMVFKDPSGKWFFLLPFVIGFVAGLIYGLADGQGWDSFGTALETGLTTGFGSALGYIAAGPVGGVMGGINGLFTGTRQIYDWKSAEGWASFITDSTWGIIGTSLGNILNIVDVVQGSSYDRANSRRQNRQVYDKGFAFGNTAFTQGNVISNLDRGAPPGQGTDREQILKHETTHILQNRLLGPVFTVGYTAWFVVGGLVGMGIALFTKEDAGDAWTEVGHDDNPFELWAYSVGGETRNRGRLAI